METNQFLDTAIIKKILLLKEPEDCNYFSQDEKVLKKIRDHFNPVIQRVREDCSRMGITIEFVGDWTGYIHLKGDASIIEQLTSQLRLEKKIIG